MSVCLDEVPDVVDSGLLYSRKHRELLVSCGDVVTAASSSREVLGVVRHIGGVTKAEPCVKFLGLELMEPKGDCDGAVFEGGETTRYFRTDPKHALFVDVRRGVAKIASDRLLQSLFQTTATLKKRTAEVQHLARERKLLCAKAADLQSANAAMRVKLLEASRFISDLRTNVVELQKQLFSYRCAESCDEAFKCPRTKRMRSVMLPSTATPAPLRLAKAHSGPDFSGDNPETYGLRRAVSADIDIGTAKVLSICSMSPRFSARSMDPQLIMTEAMCGRESVVQRPHSQRVFGSRSFGFGEPAPMDLALVSPRASASLAPPMFIAPRELALDQMICAMPKIARDTIADQSEDGSGDDIDSKLSESYSISDAKLRAIIDAKLEEKLYGKSGSIGAMSAVAEDTWHILDTYDDDSQVSEADEEFSADLLSPATGQTDDTGLSSLAPIIESPLLSASE